jgi:hypothetical protein
LRKELKLKKAQLPKIQFFKGISGIIFIEMFVCGFLPLVLARDQLPLLPEMRVKELINPQSIGWLIYLLSLLGSGIMLRMLLLPPPWHEHEHYWKELKAKEKNKNQVVDYNP